MNIFQKGKLQVIISAVVMIILGILFCALPEKSLNTLEVVVAGTLIFIGMINIFAFCFAPDFSRESGILLIGIIGIGLGVLVIFVPNSLVLALGIYTAFSGIKRVLYSIDLKTFGERNWWIDLSVGLFAFVLGVLLIVLRGTSLANNAVMIFMGVSLLLEGVLDLVMLFVLKREVAKFKKIFNSDMVEIEKTEKSDIEDSGDSNLENFTDFDVK